LGLGVILALAILSGLTFCSSLGIWDDGYGNWYMNLICAGAFGLLTLGFMLAFVYTAFGAAQMLSRGFADTWQLRVLAGRAWYIGDRALHIARDGWGSISSTTIFYEAIGTVLLEGNAVVVRGRDGAMLASIPDPSGCGMDAKEIVAHLKGLVAGATSA
jgi:hypothetical protein